MEYYNIKGTLYISTSGMKKILESKGVTYKVIKTTDNEKVVEDSNGIQHVTNKDELTYKDKFLFDNYLDQLMYNRCIQKIYKHYESR